jgi:putative restriction endonuclease
MSTGQQPENKNLAYYCQRFLELNVSRTKKGEAPYQPILILSVIELIAQGFIKDNHIFITEELRNTFNRYRNILSPDKTFDSSLSMPFFHLQNEEQQFWYLDPKPEYYSSVQINKKETNEKIRKSIIQLKKYINYAYIDRELFSLIQDDDSRQELVDTLLEKWFLLSEDRIGDILKANQAFQDYIKKEIEKLGKSERQRKGKEQKFYLSNSAARNPVFRRAVAGIYDYRCAFCRLKVNNSSNPVMQNIVEGAHIKPFAIFFNNEITNGISFCRNHHWAFDKGLFSIDDKYKIIVSRNCQEDSPNAKRKMQDFHDEPILLPDSKKYDPEKHNPNSKALEWHRENRFKA